MTTKQNLQELRIMADLVYHGIIACQEYEQKNDQKRLSECYELMLVRLHKLQTMSTQFISNHEISNYDL